MQGAGIEYLSLEEVLKVSDIVSLHVPLNDKTKGLIGEKEIALMKKKRNPAEYCARPCCGQRSTGKGFE